MLVGRETRSIAGSGYVEATASPAVELTFTSGGPSRQCLPKTSIEPHKKQSTVEHTGGTNTDETRIFNPPCGMVC